MDLSFLSYYFGLTNQKVSSMTSSRTSIVNKGGNLRDGFESQKVSNTQPRPRVQPLEFHHWKRTWDPGNALACSRARSYVGRHDIFRQSLTAPAYDRFYKSVGDKANLLLNAFEFNKTVTMISRRAIQLKKVVTSFKKLRFGEALRHLNIPDPDHSKKKKLEKTMSSKGLASTWLEFTFGWSPVVSDIYAACDIIQRPFPIERISGKSKETHFCEFLDFYHKDFYTGVDEVKISAFVRFDNPNALLADQLGLLNPALVAWDAVPFSFVADWFLPVGKFLGSITNGVGVTFLRSRTTYRQTYVGNSMETYYPESYGNYSGKVFFRMPHIPSRPTLLSRSKVPSPNLWLAATTLSLVAQQLKTFR